MRTPVLIPTAICAAVLAALACGGGSPPVVEEAPPAPPAPEPAPPEPLAPEPGTVLGAVPLPLADGQVAGLAALDGGQAALVTYSEDTWLRVVDPEGDVSREHTWTSEAITLPSGPLALGEDVAGFAAGDEVTFWRLDPTGDLASRSVAGVAAYAAARSGDGLFATGSLATWSAPTGEPFDFAGVPVEWTMPTHEAFVARFDLAGNPEWATPLGADSEGMWIAADAVGNAYVQLTGTDSSLVRIAPSGAVLWRTILPGVDHLAVDGSGAPWVAGSTDAGETVGWLDLPAPPYQPCAWEVGFVARLGASDGAPTWATVLDGPVADLVGLDGATVAIAHTRHEVLPSEGDVECEAHGMVTARSADEVLWEADLGTGAASLPQAIAASADEIVVYAVADSPFLAGRSDAGTLVRIAR